MAMLVRRTTSAPESSDRSRAMAPAGCVPDISAHRGGPLFTSINRFLLKRAHVTDEHTFTLLQADQARADLYAIEAELEVIQTHLARLPTCAYLCRIVLTATASVWALIGAVALLLIR